MAEGRLARLRADLEQLVKRWDRFNDEEDNDEFGRERYTTREECIVQLKGVLAIPPQPPEDKKEGARVAPLKAGTDGQDLPQSGSGEKSPL